jgi:TetR/AcrR family transcriptional repressor of nem operon
MPRKVNELEYSEKRDEILTVAQRLVYTKGYEQMTIQDILAELQISKGAFYHYFDSKQALLEGLIERMRQDSEQLVEGILGDCELPALVKLQRYFDTVGHWKVAQKEFLFALLKSWYADHNAIVRQKVQAQMVEHLAAALAPVIAEGYTEGVFTTPFPDQAGQLVMALLISCGESVGRLFLQTQLAPDALAQAERLVLAHNDALERVLGAPAGSLHLIDPSTLAQWFVPAEAEVDVG